MACNASIRMHWWRFEQQLAREFEPLFERFEPNVRIAWTYLGPTGFVEPAHRHWIQLAVLHKPLMVSGLFTLPGQPPLRYAPACREAAEGPGLDGASLNCGTSSADSP